MISLGNSVPSEIFSMHRDKLDIVLVAVPNRHPLRGTSVTQLEQYCTVFFSRACAVRVHASDWTRRKA